MAYLKIVRPVNCVITFAAVLIGAWTGKMITLPALFFIAGAAGFLVCAFGNVANDIADVEIDRINNPKRPLPAGLMGKKEAVIYSVLLGVASIVLGIWLGLLPLLLVLLAMSLLLGYALFLKRSLLANFIVSLTAGLSFVFGGIVAGNIFCLIPFVFAFLIHMPREIVKDIVDMDGDRTAHVRSLPILWGERRSLNAAGVFLVLLFLLIPLPYFLNIMDIAYLAVVVIGAYPLLIFLIAAMLRQPTRKSLCMQSGLLKALMGVGLVGFLCG